MVLTPQLQDEKFQEGRMMVRDSAELSSTDKQLVAQASRWITEASVLHNRLKPLQMKNERYWMGKQLDLAKMDDYQSKIVLNKIFQNLETLIPIAAANVPAPVVSLPHTDDAGEQVDYRTMSYNLEEALLAIAQENKIHHKFKKVLRYQQLHYMGVLKYGYDEETGQIWVRNVRATRIMVPDNMFEDYVIESHADTVGDMIEKFPEAAAKIKKAFVAPSATGNQGMGAVVGYFEITTPKFRFWKVNDILLHKEQNPLWDFENEANNYWKKPKLNYLFTDMWTMDKNHYAQTTLVEQTISLQDGINKRKRQISDNADQANSLMIGYGTMGITKEGCAQVRKGRTMPNNVVFLDDGVETGAISEFKAQMLPQHVFDDLVHSIKEMDNLWGTHAATRGERSPGEETFGGRQLLQTADQTRIGAFGDMIERMAEELYAAFAQIIRVKFEKEQYLAYMSTDGTSKQVKIDAKMVKDKVRIKVRSGSSLKVDKAAKSQESVVLWQNGAIDPVSLFERLDEPNPAKLAERLIKFKQDPQAYLKDVSADYASATQTDAQEKVLKSVALAQVHHQALMAGKKLSLDKKNTTVHHVALHRDFMNTPAFAQLDEAKKKMFVEHIRKELEFVKDDIKSAGAVASASNQQIMDRLTEGGGQAPSPTPQPAPAAPGARPVNPAQSSV